MDVYGMKRLLRPDDWIDIVSRKNWVPKHSAYELAQKWQPSIGFPAAIKSALTKCQDRLMATLEPELCVIEQPVYLDSKKGPSFTDAMVYCKAEGGHSVVVAVEGKARESFGPVVKEWLRGEPKAVQDSPVKRTRVRRLEFLESLLGIKVPHDSGLRYQLLHRTASAVLEAEKTGADAALMLVHSFAEVDDNWADFQALMALLGLGSMEKGAVSSPKIFAGRRRGVQIATYFAWVEDCCAPAVGLH